MFISEGADQETYRRIGLDASMIIGPSHRGAQLVPLGLISMALKNQLHFLKFLMRASADKIPLKKKSKEYFSLIRNSH